MMKKIIGYIVFRIILLNSKNLARRYAFFNWLLLGYPVRMEKSNNLFVVTDESDKINIVRPSRILLYKSSIKKRLIKLGNDYHLENVTFADGDVVVDCGANIGEIEMYFKKIQKKNIFYIGIEPDHAEFEALEANVTLIGKLYNNALWKEVTELPFFLSNETGDSTLIEGPHESTKTLVKCLTLDSIIDELKLEKIKLFKLEAEGAEPEILSGCSNENYKKIEYITVDAGYERGKNAEATLVEVCNFLFKLGFNLINYNNGRVTILFKNSRFD
jgi:FkbM family methyltransferase